MTNANHTPETLKDNGIREAYYEIGDRLPGLVQDLSAALRNADNTRDRKIIAHELEQARAMEAAFRNMDLGRML